MTSSTPPTSSKKKKQRQQFDFDDYRGGLPFEVGTELEYSNNHTKAGTLLALTKNVGICKVEMMGDIRGLIYPVELKSVIARRTAPQSEIDKRDKQTGVLLLIKSLLAQEKDIEALQFALMNYWHVLEDEHIDLLASQQEEIMEIVAELPESYQSSKKQIDRLISPILKLREGTLGDATQVPLTLTSSEEVGGQDDADDADEPVETGEDIAPNQPAGLLTLPCNLQEVAPADFPIEVIRVYERLRAMQKLADCRFDIRVVLRKVYHHLNGNTPQQTPGLRQMFCGGRTQVGKTFLKIATAMLCQELGLVAIVITPGSKSVDDLVRKFNKELSVPAAQMPQPPCLQVSGNVNARRSMISMFYGGQEQGRILIANYTAAQLEYITGAITNALGEEAAQPNGQRARRYVVLLDVLLDEADEVFKNDPDGEQNKQEVFLGKLLKYQNDRSGSCALLCNVSATLLPVFLHCAMPHDGGEVALNAEDVEILHVDETYVSQLDFRPFSVGGLDVFLDKKQLNVVNLYTSDAMLQMCQSATQVSERKTLLIDISNPRVLEKGIFAKMFRYGEHCKATPFVGLAVSGSSMMIYRLGDDEWYWERVPKKRDGREYRRVQTNKYAYDQEQPSPGGTRSFPTKTVQDVLSDIERTWNGPIVVVGYSMLFRSVSIRTATRVPTHLICAVSDGLSMEKMVQAMGRVTGNNRVILEGIMGQPVVTVLASDKDLELTRMYPSFITQLQENIGSGMTMLAALESAFRDQNIAQFRRKIGPNKRDWLRRIVRQIPQTMPIPELDYTIGTARYWLGQCKQFLVDVPSGYERHKQALIMLLENARLNRIGEAEADD